MRAISTAERDIISGSHFNIHTRVEVRDVDGNWQDLTNLSDIDWFDSGRWGWDVDNPVISGSVTLTLADYDKSISPLMGGSPINRNAADEYYPLLHPNRTIRIYTASVAHKATPVSTDWKLKCVGRVDNISATTETITFYFRDLTARLMGRFIEEKKPYSTDEGVPVQTVMQQIIDDNPTPEPVTLYVPVSPNWVITKYEQEQTSVYEAIRKLANQIGWDVAYLFGDNTNDYRLTLFEPNRDNTLPSVYTFGPDEYLFIPKYEISDADVRNVIQVKYYDTFTKTTKTVTRTNADSIAAFDRKFMGIEEAATSNINTQAEAIRLAEAVASDLGYPFAEQEIETLYFWPAELGDIYSFLPNGVHYDSAQKYTVVGITHEIQNGDGKTKILTRGEPVGAYQTWLKKGNRINKGTVLPDLDVVQLASDNEVVIFAAQATNPSSGALLDVLVKLYGCTAELNGVTMTEADGEFIITPDDELIVIRPEHLEGNGLVEFSAAIDANNVIRQHENIATKGKQSTILPLLSVTQVSSNNINVTFRATAKHPFTDANVPVVFTLHNATATMGGVTYTSADGEVAIPNGTTDIVVTKPAFLNGSATIKFIARIDAANVAEDTRTIAASNKDTAPPDIEIELLPVDLAKLIDAGIVTDGLVAAWNPSDVTAGADVLNNEVTGGLDGIMGSNASTDGTEPTRDTVNGFLGFDTGKTVNFGIIGALPNTHPLYLTTSLSIFTAVNVGSVRGGGTGDIINQPGNPQGYRLLYDYSAKAFAWVAGGSVVQPANNSGPRSQWLTVSATYARNVAIDLYQNTTKVGTDTSVPNITSPSPYAGDEFHMGGAPSSPTFQYFEGNIAPVLVYNKKLTDSEVQQNHNAFISYAISNNFAWQGIAPVGGGGAGEALPDPRFRTKVKITAHSQTDDLVTLQWATGAAAFDSSNQVSGNANPTSTFIIDRLSGDALDRLVKVRATSGNNKVSHRSLMVDFKQRAELSTVSIVPQGTNEWQFTAVLNDYTRSYRLLATGGITIVSGGIEVAQVLSDSIESDKDVSYVLRHNGTPGTITLTPYDRTGQGGSPGAEYTETLTPISVPAHTHTKADITDFAYTHPASEISDFSEALDDRVGSLITVGSNLTKTYDDNGNLVTIGMPGSIKYTGTHPNAHAGKNLAYFSIQSSTGSTGAVVLKTSIPAPASGTTVMWSIQLKGQHYLSQQTISMQLAGYKDPTGFVAQNYANTGGWNPRVQVGVTPDNFVCFILSETTTNNRYISIEVTEAHISHTAVPITYLDGWSFSIVSDLSAYTMLTSVLNKGVTTIVSRSSLQNQVTGYNLAMYGANGQTGAVVLKTSIPTTAQSTFQFHIGGQIHATSIGPVSLDIAGYKVTGGFNTAGYTNNGTWAPSLMRMAFTPDGFVAFILGDVADTLSVARLYVSRATLQLSDTQYLEGWTMTRVTDLTGYTNLLTLTDKTNVTWAGVTNLTTTKTFAAEQKFSSATAGAGVLQWWENTANDTLKRVVRWYMGKFTSMWGGTSMNLLSLRARDDSGNAVANGTVIDVDLDSKRVGFGWRIESVLQSATDVGYMLRVGTEANGRLVFLPEGFEIGAGGESARDTFIKRGASGSIELTSATGQNIRANRSLEIVSALWNGARFLLGSINMWVDSPGFVRRKNGVPTSESDEVIVPGKFAADVGDGVATTYTITHNLNTYDVDVTVYSNTAPRANVVVDVGRSSLNAVTVTFTVAPATNAYRVVVIG